MVMSRPAAISSAGCLSQKKSAKPPSKPILSVYHGINHTADEKQTLNHPRFPTDTLDAPTVSADTSHRVTNSFHFSNTRRSNISFQPFEQT